MANYDSLPDIVEQQPQGFDISSMPYRQRIDEGFARWVLEMSDELGVIEHSLKNERLDLSSGEWVARGHKKILDEDTINKIMAMLNMFIAKSTAVTAISKPEANIIAKEMGDSISQLLVEKCIITEVTAAEMDLIVKTLENKLVFILCMPVGGGGRDFINKSEQRLLTKQITEQPQGKKILGGF